MGDHRHWSSAGTIVGLRDGTRDGSMETHRVVGAEVSAGAPRGRAPYPYLLDDRRLYGHHPQDQRHEPDDHERLNVSSAPRFQRTDRSFHHSAPQRDLPQTLPTQDRRQQSRSPPLQSQVPTEFEHPRPGDHDRFWGAQQLQRPCFRRSSGDVVVFPFSMPSTLQRRTTPEWRRGPDSAMVMADVRRLGARNNDDFGGSVCPPGLSHAGVRRERDRDRGLALGHPASAPAGGASPSAPATTISSAVAKLAPCPPLSRVRAMDSAIDCSLASDGVAYCEDPWGTEDASVASPSRLSWSSSVGHESPQVSTTAPMLTSTTTNTTSTAADGMDVVGDALSKTIGQRMPGTVMPAPTKPSRYLRELDRRIILSRIAKGERQSALAKEYRVSRSTICNLYKHRAAVLSRSGENPLSRHPKKARLAAQRHHALILRQRLNQRTTSSLVSSSAAGSPASNQQEGDPAGGLGGSPTSLRKPLPEPENDAPSGSEAVTLSTTTSVSASSTTTATGSDATTEDGHRTPTRYLGFDYATIFEIESKAVKMLLGRVQHQATPAAEFMRVMDRILRLLLEEALAIVVGAATTAASTQQTSKDGSGPHQPKAEVGAGASSNVDLCAVTMVAPDKCPMLGVFRHLEPTQACARVHVVRGHDSNEQDGDEDGHSTPTSGERVQFVTAATNHDGRSVGISELEILLLDVVASTGPGMCAAIEALLKRGARPDRLTIVALFVAPEVIALVQYAFPRVRIITARIDAQLHSRQDRRDPQRSLPPSLAVLDRLQATLRRVHL